MNIRIRAATLKDAASVARVHVDSWRSTYAGIVPAEYLAGLSYRNRESAWKQLLTADRPGTSCFVAETEGGDIVGFANAGPEREGDSIYRGELYAIYILEGYQRMGIGRRLFSCVMRRLLTDGFNSTLLWVLVDNRPACRFYESLGGERVGRKTVAIGGAILVEVAYGWREIDTYTPVLENTAGQNLESNDLFRLSQSPKGDAQIRIGTIYRENVASD